MHLDGRRVVNELRDERGIDAGLRRAQARGEKNRHALCAPERIGEEPQRRAIDPVEVIHGENERLTLRQVEREPVQAVQSREARVAPIRRRVVGAREHRARPLCGARQGAVFECGLEQLADHAERELALELAAAGGEDAHAVGRAKPPQLAHELRLADPGGPFN